MRYPKGDLFWEMEMVHFTGLRDLYHHMLMSSHEAFLIMEEGQAKEA